MLNQAISTLRHRYLNRSLAARESTAGFGGGVFYGSTLRWMRPVLRLEETGGADPSKPGQPPPETTTLEEIGDATRGPSDTANPPQQPPNDL